MKISRIITALCIASIGTAQAYTAATITEMKVKDSGGGATTGLLH